MASKLAGDLFSVVEVGADYLDCGTTLYRSLGWLDVEEEGWFVVIVLGSIIGKVLSVKSQLNVGFSPVVGRWRLAMSPGGVRDCCLCHDWRVESCESAISGVSDVWLSFLSLERLEVVTSELNLVSTGLWAKIWLHNGDLRLVVVPEGKACCSRLGRV